MTGLGLVKQQKEKSICIHVHKENNLKMLNVILRYKQPGYLTNKTGLSSLYSKYTYINWLVPVQTVY